MDEIRCVKKNGRLLNWKSSIFNCSFIFTRLSGSHAKSNQLKSRRKETCYTKIGELFTCLTVRIVHLELVLSLCVSF